MAQAGIEGQTSEQRKDRKMCAALREHKRDPANRRADGTARCARGGFGKAGPGCSANPKHDPVVAFETEARKGQSPLGRGGK